MSEIVRFYKSVILLEYESIPLSSIYIASTCGHETEPPVFIIYEKSSSYLTSIFGPFIPDFSDFGFGARQF